MLGFILRISSTGRHIDLWRANTMENVALTKDASRRRPSLQAHPGPHRHPGPRRRQPMHVSAPSVAATAQLEASPNEKRRSGFAYAGFLGSLVLIGLLAWLFNSQASTVTAADTVVFRAVGTIESEPSVAGATPGVAPTTVAPAVTATTSTSSTSTTSTIPLAERELARIESVFGDIAPKSVESVGNGLFFAQNMMYRHTVTVYNEQGSLLKTISDSVDFAEFGRPELGVAQGAPVEAAATSDGRHVYVSNYAMYGPAFGPEPNDQCDNTGWDNSFLYRVDTETLEIDQVIEVGATPKFLAVSPDDRWIVVSNWCSFDASIIDTALGVEVARVDMGRHPRGVAISSDSSTAYVTQMGGTDIAKISLDDVGVATTAGSDQVGSQNSTGGDDGDLAVEWLTDIGWGPRTVLLSPDDSTLFVTLNSEGTVVKVDAQTGEVIETVRTGDAPRSMALSSDGEALYVVNYDSNTLSKIVTDSFEEVQELEVAERPIGITIDEASSDVWVSAYSGVLEIYEDTVR